MPWTTAPHTSGGDTEMMADDSARPAARGPRRPRAGLPTAAPALAAGPLPGAARSQDRYGNGFALRGRAP
ncbi:hypothetical protein AAHZ94_33660, partial [Streptomyces sp. HSW2009]|uniref:hypothetical protein n=1 Tax=Streptomyces sp. HSW2009 TaxID=3142890 RepID=UPI0032EF0DB7